MIYWEERLDGTSWSFDTFDMLSAGGAQDETFAAFGMLSAGGG